MILDVQDQIVTVRSDGVNKIANRDVVRANNVLPGDLHFHTDEMQGIVYARLQRWNGNEDEICEDAVKMYEEYSRSIKVAKGVWPLASFGVWYKDKDPIGDILIVDTGFKPEAISENAVALGKSISERLDMDESHGWDDLGDMFDEVNVIDSFRDYNMLELLVKYIDEDSGVPLI